MSPPAFGRAFAPAKINLTLHVTGQRADGYHLLDSLVMLADVGDHVFARPARQDSLEVSGPYASGVPTDASNLVVRAAALMGGAAHIKLAKHLPAAAGIGGGSSDAAACLRALSRAADLPLPDLKAQLSLGADVPVCMYPDLTRMSGIGEQIDVVAPAPDWPMVLVNPGVEVPTASVFSGLQSKENGSMQGAFPTYAGQVDQVQWLSEQRNDLETPAIAQAPVIGQVLEKLASASGCQLARMSGSGATCFAIMASEAQRDQLVDDLRVAEPEWWVMPTTRCGALFT